MTQFHRGTAIFTTVRNLVTKMTPKKKFYPGALALSLISALVLFSVSGLPMKAAETVTLYMEINEWLSCPFLFSWDGNEYQLENDIYSVGKRSSNEFTDYLYIGNSVVPRDGVYSFEVRELPSEQSFTDVVKLMTIDHPAGVSVGVDSSGNAHSYSNPVAPDSAVDQDGTDVLSLIDTRDDNGLDVFHNDYLTLDFSPVDITDGAKLIMRLDGFQGEKSGDLTYQVPKILIQTQESGEWVTRDSFYPKELYAEGVFDLKPYLTESKMVRLFTVSCLLDKYHVLDYVALDNTADDLTMNVIDPLTAVNDGEDVLSSLLASDNDYAFMNENDIMSLTFAANPLTDDVRDFAFISEGYYEQIGNTYYVYTWTGSSWASRYSVEMDSQTDTMKQTDLSDYLPDTDGEYKVKISHTDMTMMGQGAEVDYVYLKIGDTTYTPSYAKESDTTDILSKINTSDDVKWNAFQRWAIVKFTVVTAAPEISIGGGSSEIGSGDTTPSSNDNTDFGSINVASGGVDHTFTITNAGTANLTLDGDPIVALSNDASNSFSVTTQPFSPIAAGDHSTFQVTFDPSVPGVHTANLSISNNDADENPYTFALKGTGLKTLTVSGITVSPKEYDGTTAATLDTSGAALVGVEEGDTVGLDLSGVSGTFSNEKVGTGKVVSISGLVLTGADKDYYNLTQPTAAASITQRSITVTAASDTKEYDGTTSSTGTPTITSGSLVEGDSVTWTQTFDTKHAGTEKTLTPAGTVSDGNSGNNYTVTYTGVSTGTITQRDLVVTGVSDTKIYDGSVNSTETPLIMAGSLAAGDSVTWTQTFDTKHYGTSKTMTPAGTVSDGNSGNNYNVTYLGANGGTIAKRSVTVTAATDTKVYDGDVTSTGTPTITTGSLAAGDSVTWTQTFDSKDAGTEKTLTPGGTITDGNNGSNYNVSYVTDTTGVVTKKTATITGITVSDRIYDGTTEAELETDLAVITGIVPGDTVLLDTDSASGTFADKHAGSAKPVTIMGCTLTGDDASNYSYNQPSTSADITKRDITITAVTDTKAYDGTTSSAGDPTLTPGSLAGSDTAAYIQTFDTKNAGGGKTLTPAGTINDGNGGNNYNVTLTSVSTGTITKLDLTVTAATDTKEYDGTVTSSGTPTLTSGSLAGGDSAVWSQTFDTKHVGTDKTLTPAGTITDGNNGNNYNVTLTGVTTGTITQLDLKVTAAADTKEYDGTTSSSGIPTVTAGALAAGDSAVWSQTFDTRNVGTSKTLAPDGTITDGNGGANYNVTLENVSTGTITKRAITVTAATDTKVYDGSVNSTALPTITTGLLATGDSAVWSQSFDTEKAGTTKTLTPTGTVTDGNGGNNYNVTLTAAATGTITKRDLTVTAATDTKFYDGTVTSTGTPTITSGSLVTGDSAVWSQTFDTKNAGTGKTLTPAGTITDGNGGNNYNVTLTGVSTGTVTKRDLTVTAVTDTKVYDGSVNSTALPMITTGSLIGGDSAVWSQTFDTKHAGTGKAITPAGTITDGNSGNNYNVTLTGVSTGTVTKRDLTVTAVTDTKVYDGTTSSSGTPTVTAGSLAAGDSTAWIQTFDTKHAGTSKTLAPDGTVTDGNNGDNYNVTLTNVSTGTVTKRDVTVTATTDTKVYDGSVNSTALPTITTGSLAAGDSAAWTQTFDTKNVGANKTLTPAGTITDGNSGNNYTISWTTDTTGVVTQKPVAVSGVVADDKPYSGTATATLTLSGASLTGIVVTDNVSLNATGYNAVFADQYPGTGKNVTITGMVLNGTDAANYALTQPSAVADITKKPLTVTGITAQSKTFDGTNSVVIDVTNAALTGVVGSENVTIDTSNATGTFTSSAAGTNKVVIVSGIVLQGADMGNYSLVQPVTTANINPAPSAGGGGGGTSPTEPEEEEEPEPAPTPQPKVIATVDTKQEPVAESDTGEKVAVTGNLITVSENETQLVVNIPVALNDGEKLGSFTDATGVTYKDKSLEIPASSGNGSGFLLKMTDGENDLEASLVIETGDCVGTGDEAKAEVKSIKSKAGITRKDLSEEDPTVGTVASSVNLDLNKLPEDAEVKITTTKYPSPEADTSFHLAADSAGMGKIEIAYTINVEKTNISNGSDIASATITMCVSQEWVDANGGLDAIKIIRWEPDTRTRQVLVTTFIGYDDQGMAVFEGYSPDGLSEFALVGVPVVAETEVQTEPVDETVDTTVDEEPVQEDPVIEDQEEETPVIVAVAPQETAGFPWWIIILIVGIGAAGFGIWWFVIKPRNRSAEENK